MVAKAAIAGEHIGHALFECSVPAVPINGACAKIDHRTPRSKAYLGQRRFRAERYNGKQDGPEANYALHRQPHRLLPNNNTKQPKFISLGRVNPIA